MLCKLDTKLTHKYSKMRAAHLYPGEKCRNINCGDKYFLKLIMTNKSEENFDNELVDSEV